MKVTPNHVHVWRSWRAEEFDNLRLIQASDGTWYLEWVRRCFCGTRKVSEMEL